MSMKSRYATLAIGVVSLALFGWGCGDSQSKVESQKSKVGDRTERVVQATASTATESGDVVVMATEPQGLAYLLLPKDAKATVTRGTAKTDAVHEMELFVGDAVEVTSGKAFLQFPETGLSSLDQGTKVALMPDGNPAEDGLGIKIMLEAGKIWTRLERLLGKDEAMTVQASDVVATVRGTAFGVAFVDGDVDVTVADHQVRVSTKTMLNTGKLLTESVLISAGNAVRVDPRQVSKMTDMRTLLQKGIRALTPAEKLDAGYIFGTQPILQEFLERPVNPFRWSVDPVLSPEVSAALSPEGISRLQSYILWYGDNHDTLLRTEQLMRASSVQPRFMPPLRSVDTLDQLPTTTPSIRGPITSS